MKFSKIKFSNVLFIVIIALLIIPTTRKPIQVFVQKGLMKISPLKINKSNQKILTNYNWRLKNNKGEMYDFKDAKGKVVFINFWATWCPPCIAEMSSINELYKDYNQDVVFLLVTNEKEHMVADFMLKNDYKFNYQFPLTDIPEPFKTSSIPQTYIIDKLGQIVVDKNGVANWNGEAVRTLINNLLKSN